MKTYEQMARSVLSKRDAYDEKKRKRDRIRMTVAGALAALMIINVMIIAPVIARKSKDPDAAPIAEQTTVAPDNGTSDAITDGTTEENGETTEEKGTETDEIAEIDRSYLYEFVYTKDIEEKEKIIVRRPEEDFFKRELAMYMSEPERIKTFRLRYNNVTYFGGDSDTYPENVNFFIETNGNVKMLSPQAITLYLENGSAEFDVTFEYIDNKTNAEFRFYMNCSSSEEVKEKKVEYAGFSERAIFSVATVKDHDFYGKFRCSGLYTYVARYYGDVDKNGIPLYENDPYMPEYYDNPWCELERKVPHVIVEHNDSNYRYFNDSGQTRSDEIMVCGYIRWTASDNSVHPARNMTVYVIDRSDPNNRHETLTDDTGYYVIRYPVSSFYGHTVGAYAELS